MRISSDRRVVAEILKRHETVRNRFGSDTVISMRRIPGGGNNRIYAVRLDSGQILTAKLYSPQTNGRLQRLEREYTGFTFLSRNGLRNVPEPLARDDLERVAIYTMLEGKPIASSSVTARDVEALCGFFTVTNALKFSAAAGRLPAAAEACFSLSDIVTTIRSRYLRLTSVAGSENRPLTQFLTREFMPGFTEIVQWARSQAREKRIGFGTDLARKHRVLSPSDFGFHNALRQPDGTLAYLDFEYFGWDDPAKTVSDFLLHPRMHLSRQLKQLFIKRLTAGLAQDRQFPDRLKIAYPLYALKWVLILLNEFIPDDFRRRQFATVKRLKRPRVRAMQLAKSKRLLSRTMSVYTSFPYDV